MLECSRSAMGGYEDVNREIHNFLSQKTGSREQVKQQDQATPDILPLLESLSRTYNDINAYLKSGNAEGLKDKILKSDVKMSLVCETLLETLKVTTEEKNRLAKENAKLSVVRREFEEKGAQQRLRIEQLERDLECRSSDVKELGRLIQDQKDRMSDYRDEAQRVKSDGMINLTKVQELENLRAKAMERLQVYEREMDAIRGIIKEREERIATLVREKRGEEDKNSSIKIRIVECEKMVEVMSKKLESKDLNLSLCNEELSKVLAENKMMKGDFEKYREKGAYYEGLYGSLNKQNVYLNSQLNKMLKETEYTKDGAEFIRKYRMRSKKKKRMIKKLREENGKLKAKLAGVADATCTTTIVTESSDTIVKRVEELTETNQALRKQIFEAESAKRNVEERLRKLGSGVKRDEYPGQRRSDSGFQTLPHNVEKPSLVGNKNEYHFGAPAAGREYRSDYIGTTKLAETRLPREAPFREMFSSPAGVTAIMPELRGRKEEYPKPNLYNNYEDATGIPGGFVDDTIVGQPEDTDGVVGDRFVARNKNMEPLPTLFGSASKLSHAAPKQKTTATPKSTSRVQPEKESRGITEGHSNDSIKTYHTTSTLRDMISRTDRLQERFESLEDQLAHIKEGNTEERLVDKMRTYSTHYSELNIDSNDSDFI